MTKKMAGFGCVGRNALRVEPILTIECEDGDMGTLR
jgi:hypothetical protein